MSIYNIKNFVDRREEILNLLNQLTTTQLFDENRFINIVYSLNDNHNIFVYLEDNKIVGIITLLIEQKLIHNGACVAHIEDLVVDKNYLNRGIAKKLIKVNMVIYCFISILLSFMSGNCIIMSFLFSIFDFLLIAFSFLFS